MHRIAASLLLAVGVLSTTAVLADEEADRFFLHQRLAPGMTAYPTQTLLDAYAKSLELPLHSSAARDEATPGTSPKSLAPLPWTALGPGNFGGRTRAIRFEPGSSTRIYAGGVAGGVWRSDDAGGSWTPLGDAMANLAVTAILVNPANPQILLAGTGENTGTLDGVRGAGIFRSTNGGATWTQAAGTATTTAVNEMVYKPGDPNVVWAATNAGLLQSLDGGATFADATSQITFGCQSVVYRSDADAVLASCTFSTTGPIIFRSNNASVFPPSFDVPSLGRPGSGASQTLASMGYTRLAVAPSNSQIVYALIACARDNTPDCANGTYTDGLLAVYQSTNGGTSWTARKTNSFNTATPFNGDLMLTNPLLQKQTQCGYGPSNNFSNVGSHAGTIAVDPLDPARVWVGGVDLWRSDDSGASWGVASYWWFARSSTKRVPAEHHAIAFDPAFNGAANQAMFVTGDGGIFRTTNARAAVGTVGTADATNSLCGNGGQPAVDWGGRNNGYAVTQFNHGSVYPNGTQYFGGAQDIGVVSGNDSLGPNTWFLLYGQTGDPLAPWTYNNDGGFTAINPNVFIYMGNRRISIRRSGTDGLPAGSGWGTKISGIATPSCGLLINPFQLDPNNAARLYTSHNVLWRTSDNADNWTQASAPLSGTSCTPIDVAQSERFSNYAIAPGNPNLLVAGTDQGRICRLVNAMTSTAATALADCTSPAGTAYVSAIAFDPANTNTVYATFSTFNVGHVWKSVNGGQTWANIDGSGGGALPNSPVHTVVVSPFTSDTIFVGTEIGVFVTRDNGATWARENTGFANVITDHLVFVPGGPTGQRIFAFTHGRGVFRAPITPTADVSISVTDSQTSVNAGASVSYTIVATNPTANAVNNVAVGDSFPAALSSCTWTCSAPGGGSCTGSGSGNISESVRIAATNTVTFSATCALSTAAFGTLANTATLDYGNDPNASNDSATDNDSVVPRADLSVNKFDNRTTTNPGQSIGYNIDVVNPNPATAVANVTVTDTFPAELINCSWVCFASSGGACGTGSGNGAINQVVTLGPGPSGFLGFGVTCTLVANATGTVSNTATISYANDTNVANNTSTDTDAITQPADVSITNTDGVGSVAAGSGVTYTIVATNSSNNTIGFVTVADAFPASLGGCTWTCAASPGSDCGGAGSSGNINRVVTLAASGGTATFTASCTVAAGATGTLSNTASASYPNDTVLGNNSATDADAIVAQADVSITKSDGTTAVVPGASVAYTIVASNPAAAAIANVRVVDTFPSTLGNCTWTCSASGAGSCEAPSGTGNIDRVATIAAAGTATYVATCTLAAGATGSLANTATTTYGNDPNGANDNATDTDTILSDALFKNGFE